MIFYHEDARDIPIIAEPEILVAGAGPAGIGAAMAAARSGAQVMLIEKGAYPGGIATMGMMSHWSGATQCPLMNEIAERTMKSAALPAETNPGLSKFDLFWGIPHECLKQVLFEMLKEAGRLHIAEAATFFVELDLTAHIVIVFVTVGVGENRLINDQVGGELLVFRLNFLNQRAHEGVGHAENMGGIKFVAVFNGFNRTINGGNFLG